MRNWAEECFDVIHHWFPNSCKSWLAARKNLARAVRVVDELMHLTPLLTSQNSTEKSSPSPRLCFSEGRTL